MQDIPLYQGKTKNILVISGGGIKGFSALGAITRLKELDIINNPDIYCGTSAGSAISLLLLIGYSSQNIYEILSELDMSKIVINNIDNILDEVHIGFNLSDPIIYIIGHMMKRKKISTKITFVELFKKTGKKLIITGVCLNDASLHYFSHETTPNMEVLTAIAISISIPIIFKPILYNNKIWVDGGVMNNYPIDLFNDRINDVIGIYLDEEYTTYQEFEDVQSYVFQVIKCIFRGMNYGKVEMYKNNTIHIKTKNVPFDYEMSKKDIDLLYKMGYDTVNLKFDK
jgi:NTE family protein